MMRNFGRLLFCTFAVLGFISAAQAQTSSAASSAPHLAKQGSATQLIVDGKPFLGLAGELHNSSSSSVEYMAPIWPKLAAIHVNLVLTPVSWQQIEPEEGKFNFTVLDGVLKQARASGLHVGLIWFASWKNGVSTYPPAWVKSNVKRFPRARNEAGQALEILSTLSTANRDADAHAFAALMRLVKEIDSQNHTVVIIQVENEVGVLEDTRDRSPMANEAFNGPVPKELMDYLQQPKDTLAPEFRKVWEDAGAKTSGTWEEVFGAGKPKGFQIPVRTLSPPMTEAEHETEWRNLHWPVDEIFMAWNYSRYVNYVTAAGKKEYNIPMYVNAWLQQRDHAWPGTYPSGGPLPQVLDVWRAGGNALDMHSPDLYVPEFDELCARYTRNGNPFFIPESAGDDRGAANTFTAFGSYNGMGYSPFGIENPNIIAPDSAIAKVYEFLSRISPMILEHQASGTIAGVTLDKTHLTREVKLGGYTITFGFARPWGVAQNPDYAGAIVMQTGEGEYVVAGKSVTVSFSVDRSPVASSSVGPSADPKGQMTTGLASVQELVFSGGKWAPGRLLNGDEIMSGKGLRLSGDNYVVQKVKLYQYR